MAFVGWHLNIGSYSVHGQRTATKSLSSIHRLYHKLQLALYCAVCTLHTFSIEIWWILTPSCITWIHAHKVNSHKTNSHKVNSHQINFPNIPEVYNGKHTFHSRIFHCQIFCLSYWW